MGKEEHKLSAALDDAILYTRPPKILISKPLNQVSMLNKLERYKINMYNP